MAETSPAAAVPDAIFIDNRDESRFEMRVGGNVAAFTVYERHGDSYAFVHTETKPGFEHSGLATMLVQQTMDTMRERGAQVLPFCPFVLSWMADHSDYAALVPKLTRVRLGL